jgi:Domain of unknown function (DUF4383)
MRTSPNRLLATILGTVYLVVGVAGFFVTSGVGFFSNSGRLLVGLLGSNPFLSCLDVLIGAALLMAGLTTIAAAKTMTTVAGTAFLVLGIAGLFVIGGPFNVLALNGAANVLHSASAVVLLAVGLGADRSVTPAVTS